MYSNNRTVRKGNIPRVTSELETESSLQESWLEVSAGNYEKCLFPWASASCVGSRLREQQAPSAILARGDEARSERARTFAFVPSR